MDNNNFENALARAQKYMLDENWQNQVSFAEKQQSKKQYNNGGNGNDLAAMEAAAGFGVSSNPTDGLDNVQYTGQGYNGGQQNMYEGVQMLQEHPRTPRQTKLPANIRESFEKTPPLSGENYGAASSAVQNFMAKNGQLPNRQMVQEQYAPQPQPMMPQSNGGINYELIKYMIEEAIDKKMKTLNESTGMAGMAGMRICDGNKIQFLDKKGNLYEGILTLKKKANR